MASGAKYYSILEYLPIHSTHTSSENGVYLMNNAEIGKSGKDRNTEQPVLSNQVEAWLCWCLQGRKWPKFQDTERERKTWIGNWPPVTEVKLRYCIFINFNLICSDGQNLPSYCTGSGNDYATDLPILGKTVHAFPPLKPRFSLASSSVFIQMLLLIVAVVTSQSITLVMSAITIALRSSLMSSTVTSMLTSLMTTLSASLETTRTPPTLQIEPLHSIFKASHARSTLICPSLLSVNLTPLKFWFPAFFLPKEASFIFVKPLLTTPCLTLALSASPRHLVVCK